MAKFARREAKPAPPKAAPEARETEAVGSEPNADVDSDEEGEVEPDAE